MRQTGAQPGLLRQLRNSEAEVDRLSKELYRLRHPTDAVSLLFYGSYESNIGNRNTIITFFTPIQLYECV